MYATLITGLFGGLGIDLWGGYKKGIQIGLENVLKFNFDGTSLFCISSFYSEHILHL